ncbi:MAG: hypothetical protein REDVDVYQ_002358, partial [Candidatus Fervidibacter sp.]
MNRESIVAELANVLQVTEEEAERLLRAFAKVLGPFAVELPPYFERYFEAQIQLVLQRIDEGEKRTDQRFQELEKRINERLQELEKRTDQRFQEMEKRTDQRFQELERRTDERFQQLEQRIDQRFQELE